MLASMRTLSKSIVSKLLMLLLVLSFGVWGVGDILKDGGNAGYAAKVGGETISIGEFQQQRNAMKQRLESMGFKDLPPGKVEMMVIRQLVTQKLSTLAMRDMGLFVSDETIAKSIANMEEFRDENGKFSKVRYTYMLSKQRIPEQVFLANYKRELSGQFLVDSLSMADATAPASILTLQAIGTGETRDVVLLTVPASDAAEGDNEEALKAYYAAHKDSDYMRSETRTLEYVVLTQSDLDTLAAKGVTDDMVTQEMATRKKTDKAELRAQLVKEQRDDVTRELGNNVEDELAAGKTIAQAFSTAGITAQPHVLENVTADTAKMSADDVIRTVAEQGFGLSEGEISRLVTTKKGTLLMVSAKKITPASPKPYEEVKADVKSHLAKELAVEAARAKAQRVKEALATSPNWQAVAADKKVSTRLVSRISRPVEGKAPLEGIPPSLQQAIFQRNVNEVAGPLALANGDQVLALVTASRLPNVSAAELKSSKDSQGIAQQLGQNVEAHAFQAFSDKHPVDINPQIMRGAEAQE